jgi:tetratricopeptide (TPR) repeat protein
VTITGYLIKLIDILKISMSFLNKNSPAESMYFDMLKDENDELFYIISRIRVFGYVIRAYIKFIQIKKTLKYTISMNDYDYILNDCNKVLNILERDFRLSNIQHGEDEAETRENFNKNAKWIYFASVAINIMKGYVYYEIKNNARALDAFCHAIRFYNKIIAFSNSATQKTPFDIAKAKLIMGKIFVDKGLFLNSLYWYLESLHDFLYVFNNLEDIRTIQNTISDQLSPLLIEKHNDIIDKNIVFELLRLIDVSALTKIETEAHATEWAKGYISDILSRAGYVFYILLSNVEGVQHSIKIWFEVAFKLNPNNSLAIQNLSLMPSGLGNTSIGQALSSVLVVEFQRKSPVSFKTITQVVPK